MAVLRLAGKTPSPRSLERERLAAAITSANDLAAEVAQLEDAKFRLERTCWAATATLETGPERLQAAQDETVAALLRGSDTIVNPAVLVQRDLAEAEATLTANRATLERIKERLQDRTQRLTAARSTVRQRIPSVVQSSPEMAALVEEMRRRHAALTETALTYMRLAGQGCGVDHAGRNYLHVPFNAAVPAPAWDVALTALQTDADAPLPAVG